MLLLNLGFLEMKCSISKPSELYMYMFHSDPLFHLFFKEFIGSREMQIQLRDFVRCEMIKVNEISVSEKKEEFTEKFGTWERIKKMALKI